MGTAVQSGTETGSKGGATDVISLSGQQTVNAPVDAAGEARQIERKSKTDFAHLIIDRLKQRRGAGQTAASEGKKQAATRGKGAKGRGDP